MIKTVGAWAVKTLCERSTWMGFVGVIAGAAVLPAPYSYYSIAMGFVGILCPDGKK